MSKTVYVVFDTELEKVVGVFDNPEAADECENAVPGDRYTEGFDLSKNYNDEEDPRHFNEDLEDYDSKEREPYEDDKFYETEEEDPDPYGD